MNWQLAYDHIPLLSNFFTREVSGFVEAGIVVEEYGIAGLFDRSIPVHEGIVTAHQNSIKFATEETMQGLKHNSLEQYTTDANRIVCMYYWHGWDDMMRQEAAIDFIDATIAHGGDASKYATLQLGHFLKADHLPLIGHYFDPARTQKKWCSEYCLMLLKIFGAEWVKDIYLDPLQSLRAMHDSGECSAILGYYKMKIC
jgi:hypothetical protein